MRWFETQIPRWPPAAVGFLAGAFLVVVSLGMSGGRIAAEATRSGRLLLAVAGLTLAFWSALVLVRLVWVSSQVWKRIVSDWERDE